MLMGYIKKLGVQLIVQLQRAIRMRLRARASACVRGLAGALLLCGLCGYFSSPAYSENYYQPPFCPAGTKEKVTLVGEVNPSLLPRHSRHQGKTPTCSFHA